MEVAQCHELNPTANMGAFQVQARACAVFLTIQSRCTDVWQDLLAESSIPQDSALTSQYNISFVLNASCLATQSIAL